MSQEPSDMEFKRRELIQQIYNVRRLTSGVHIGWQIHIEVGIHIDLWVYLCKDRESPYQITLSGNEWKMMGVLVYEVYDNDRGHMRYWTEDEKKLGFAVKLKVP